MTFDVVPNSYIILSLSLSLSLSLCRYGQLIYLHITRSKVYDIITLQRDSSLLRFLHGFLVSAPLLSVQLYTITTAIINSDFTPQLVLSPLFVVFASFISSALSLLLTLIVYILSDRLHAERRRVVIPAYIVTFLWHLFVIPARIFAMVLFAVAYGPYIAVVIGVHWGAAIIWTLAERTNFCGDLSTTPPKKRYVLELPFVSVVSFIFLFIYFNVRDGSTMVRIIVYHLLTAVETLLLSALFYVAYPNLSFSPWVFALSVSSYGLGVAFMFLYYAAWHPNRTEDCFLCIGCPKSCECCNCFLNKGELHLGNVDLPLDGERRRESPSDEERRTGGDIEGEEGPVVGPVIGKRTSNQNGVHTNLPPPPNGAGFSSINNINRSTAGTPTHVRPSSQLNHHSSSAVEIPHNTSLYGGSGESPYSLPFHQVGVSHTRTVSLENIKRQSPYGAPSRGSVRNGEEKRWPVKTKSENLPKRMLPLVTNASDPRSIPLPRRRSDSQLLPTTTSNKSNYVNVSGKQRYSMIVHPDLQLSSNINLPSPIGEEPGAIDGGRKWSSPLPILHVSSADSPGRKGEGGRGRGKISKERRGSGSLLPSPYSFMYVTPPTPVNADMTSSSMNPSYVVQSSSQLESRFYLEPGSGRGVKRFRHRSLSPDVRSSEESGCGYPSYPRSANATPKQSPYSSRRSSNGCAQRKRRSGSSNPLHSGDPMVEFTQLYTSGASPTHIRRPSSRSSARVSTTCDESSDCGVGRKGRTSACSSGVFSSDKSDTGFSVPPTGSEVNEPRPVLGVESTDGHGWGEERERKDKRWQPSVNCDVGLMGGDTLV